MKKHLKLTAFVVLVFAISLFSSTSFVFANDVVEDNDTVVSIPTVESDTTIDEKVVVNPPSNDSIDNSMSVVPNETTIAILSLDKNFQIFLFLVIPCFIGFKIVVFILKFFNTHYTG